MKILYKFFRFVSRLRLMYTKFGFILKGYKIGHVVFHGAPIIYGPSENLVCGTNVHVNHSVTINCRDKVSIGNNVHLSDGSKIQTGMLSKNREIPGHINGGIKIEDDVWIASGVVISPGLTIGKGSVVDANSVVLKDIGSNEIWGGVPAKRIS
jgi:acetyltransferase-like isoleucine patch superfamily enzyme